MNQMGKMMGKTYSDVKVCIGLLFDLKICIVEAAIKKRTDMNVEYVGKKKRLKKRERKGIYIEKGR